MSDQKESEWKKLHSRLQFCLVIQDLKCKKITKQTPKQNTTHRTDPTRKRNVPGNNLLQRVKP